MAPGAADSPTSSSPRIALLLPALNEEQALVQLLDELPRGLFARVVVVDNGSTDGTAEVARRRGAEVVREPERGYGRACLAGLAALEGDVDIVVFMDADGSDVPAEAERLLAPILAGEADLVIGSRALGTAEPGSLRWAQRWGNGLAVELIRLLYAHRYTDLGPFRALRWASLEQLEMRDPNFGWTAEMQVKALQRGLRVREVPVSYRVRLGRSKISGTVKGTAQAGAKILWTILRLRLPHRS
ncbi:MAG: glycosyltransferase family 2 protein [Acidobacteria bacterium]|nr:glycosyltransferase family 2 protein [Acidobacteriota bacterium]